MNRPLWIAAIALAACAGCGKGDEARTLNASGQQIEQQQKDEVKRLETASHLPPQARAMSVQMMQTQQKNAQASAAYARK